MKQIILILVSVFAISAYADTFSISEKEQKQIREEAENWIDDMPEGLQDRLSDAVNHAMHGFNSEIELFRNYSDTTGIGKYNSNVEILNGGDSNDIPMRIYSANSSERRTNLPVLVYFHGGGWSLGSLNTVDKFCRALASEGNVKVISVEYPLSPEHPYPSALNKCIEAVNYIYRNGQKLGIDTSKINLGGDGAGGNLALKTYFKTSQNISIQKLVLYYPLLQTNGALPVESKREFGRGYGFDSRLWEIFIAAYKDSETTDFSNLPPVLLISAGRDIVINQEKEFAGSSGNIKFIEFEGALHGFLTDGHQTTAFNKAVALTDKFLVD